MSKINHLKILIVKNKLFKLQKKQTILVKLTTKMLKKIARFFRKIYNKIIPKPAPEKVETTEAKEKRELSTVIEEIIHYNPDTQMVDIELGLTSRDVIDHLKMIDEPQLEETIGDLENPIVDFNQIVEMLIIRNRRYEKYVEKIVKKYKKLFDLQTILLEEYEVNGMVDNYTQNNIWHQITDLKDQMKSLRAPIDSLSETDIY